jgi:hypothetical protein
MALTVLLGGMTAACRLPSTVSIPRISALDDDTRCDLCPRCGAVRLWANEEGRLPQEVTSLMLSSFCR